VIRRNVGVGKKVGRVEIYFCLGWRKIRKRARGREKDEWRGMNGGKEEEGKWGGWRRK